MTIRVTVVYALPHEQVVVELELRDGATAAEAIDAEPFRKALPEGVLPGAEVGVWGVPASAATILRDRDRVEIYRELVADPKQVRRKRAGEQRRKTGR